MSKKGYLRCPPFCYVDCNIQHHPLIVALINIDESTSSCDDSFSVLDELIDKYEKQGDWKRTFPIPDTNPEYRFPLVHWAAILGLVKVMKWLFHVKGCLVSETDDKDPILHKAIDFLHENTRFNFNEMTYIVKEILSVFSSHLMVKDRDGNTPMHLCCLAFQTPLSRLKQTYYLNWTYAINTQHKKVTQKEKFEQLLKMQNNNGDTPLHILATHGDNYNLLKTLVDGLSLVCGTECDVDLLIKNNENMTVLDVATVNGNVKMCTLLSKYSKTDKKEKDIESVSHATRFSRQQSAFIKKIINNGSKETPEKNNASVTPQRNRKCSSSSNSISDVSLDEIDGSGAGLQISCNKNSSCSNSPQVFTENKSGKNTPSKSSKRLSSKTVASDRHEVFDNNSSPKTGSKDNKKTDMASGKNYKTQVGRKKHSLGDQVDDNDTHFAHGSLKSPDSSVSRQKERKIKNFGDFMKESVSDKVDSTNETKANVHQNASDNQKSVDRVVEKNISGGKPLESVRQAESLSSNESRVQNSSFHNMDQAEHSGKIPAVSKSPAVSNRRYYSLDKSGHQVINSGLYVTSGNKSPSRIVKLVPASNSKTKDTTSVPPSKTSSESIISIPPSKTTSDSVISVPTSNSSVDNVVIVPTSNSPNRLYYGLDGDDVKITAIHGNPALEIVQNHISASATTSNKGPRKGMVKIPKSNTVSPVGVVQVGKFSLPGTITTPTTTSSFPQKCRLVPTNIVIGGQGTKIKKLASIPASKSLPTNISALARASLMAYLKKISQGKTVVDLTAESNDESEPNSTITPVASQLDPSQSAMYVIPASEAQTFLSLSKVEIPDEKSAEDINDLCSGLLNNTSGENSKHLQTVENLNTVEFTDIPFIKTEPEERENENTAFKDNQNTLGMAGVAIGELKMPAISNEKISNSDINQEISEPAFVEGQSCSTPIMEEGSESGTKETCNSGGKKRKRKDNMLATDVAETPIKLIKVEPDLQFDREEAFSEACCRRSPSPADSVHDTSSTISDLSTNITDETSVHNFRSQPIPAVLTSPGQMNSSLPRYSSEQLVSPSGYSSTGSLSSEPSGSGRGIMSYLSVCSDASRQEFLETLMRDKVKYNQEKEELEKQYQDACTQCDKKIEETKFKNASLKYYLKKVMDIQKDLYKLSKETNEITEQKNQIASRKHVVDKKLETCENAVAEFKNMML